MVKQTVHNLWTGTFKAKGRDQQKRFEKIFRTVLKPQKSSLSGQMGWVGHITLVAPLPTHTWGLCATTRLKNQTHNSVTKENPLQTAEE